MSPSLQSLFLRREGTLLVAQQRPGEIPRPYQLRAVVADNAGNQAVLSGASNYNPAGVLQVQTSAPTIASIATSGTGISGGTGDVKAGEVITLTVNLSQAVKVTGSPTSPSTLVTPGTGGQPSG